MRCCRRLWPGSPSCFDGLSSPPGGRVERKGVEGGGGGRHPRGEGEAVCPRFPRREARVISWQPTTCVSVAHGIIGLVCTRVILPWMVADYGTRPEAGPNDARAATGACCIHGQVALATVEGHAGQATPRPGETRANQRDWKRGTRGVRPAVTGDPGAGRRFARGRDLCRLRASVPGPVAPGDTIALRGGRSGLVA